MLYKEISIVSAIQWTGKNFQDIREFLPKGMFALGNESGRDRKTGDPVTPSDTEVLLVNNPPHSQVWLKPLDWLVVKDKHSIKAVSNESFQKLYSRVS